MSDHNENSHFEQLIQESLRLKKKNELKEKFERRQSSSSRRLLYQIAASLLIVACAIVGFQNINRPTSQELAQAYLDDVEVLAYHESTRNAGASSMSQELDKALDAMDSKNYDEAVSRFAKYEKVVPLSNVIKLKYAYCILKANNKNVNKSRDLLKSMDDPESAIETEALYLLGLTEVLLEDKKAAAKVFQELNSKSDYKKKESNKLLNTLNH